MANSTTTRETNGDHIEANNRLEKEMSPANELYRSITQGSISPELFERLYLSPQSKVKGDLRGTFGNPTPVAIMGFTVALTPLAIALMGWRGAGGAGIATATNHIFFGGMLLIIAGLLEFVLGNTFPFVVFMGYGAHFLTLGTAFMPQFNTLAYFTGTATSDGVTTAAGGFTPTFLASFSYYTLSMCLLSFVFMICSLRTNAFFFGVFLTASMGFGFATGGFFNLSYGEAEFGTNLLIGAGACFFVAAMFGWYLLASILFGVMELPFLVLPVFDLSTVVKAKRPKA